MTDQQRKITGPEQSDAPTRHDVNVAAGLSTRPENIAAFEPVMHLTEGPTRRAFHASKEALIRVTESLGQMKDAEQALRSRRPEDRMLGPKGEVMYVIPEQRKADFATALSTSFSRGAQRLQDANDLLDSTHAALEQQIASALTDPRRNETSRAQNAGEIRRHVKDLPPLDRQSFVLQRIDEGDTEVTQAILAGSPWVSGFDRQQFALIKETAAKRFAPTAHAQREAVAGIKSKLTAAGQSYLEKFQSMVPRPNIVAARGDAALAKLRGGK